MKCLLKYFPFFFIGLCFHYCVVGVLSYSLNSSPLTDIFCKYSFLAYDLPFVFLTVVLNLDYVSGREGNRFLSEDVGKMECSLGTWPRRDLAN